MSLSKYITQLEILKAQGLYRSRRIINDKTVLMKLSFLHLKTLLIFMAWEVVRRI
jgi:hypothetical protein